MRSLLLAKFTILKYKMDYQNLKMLYLSLADCVISYNLCVYERSYKALSDERYKLQLSTRKNFVPNKVRECHQEDYNRLFNYFKALPIFDKHKVMIVCEGYDRLHTTQKIKTRPITHTKLSTFNNTYGKRLVHYLLPNVLNSFLQEIID